MIRLTSTFASAAVAAFVLVGAASAQTPAPATTAPAAKTAPAAPAATDSKMAPTDKKAAKPRTAASLECSKQADAKGLHGKERKKFRSDCKQGMKTN